MASLSASARLSFEKLKSFVLRHDPVQQFEGKLPRAILLAPIIIIGLWWLFSFALYASDWPIEYSRQNFQATTLLVFGTLFATLIAFALTHRSRSQVIQPPAQKHASPYMVAGLAISIVLLVPFSEYYSGYRLWEIGTALANQGAAFSLASERIMEGTQSRIWVVALQTIAAPLTMCLIPYFSLSWFERRRHLTYFLMSASVPVAQSVLTGRDFQLVTTGVLIGCAWLVSRIRRRIFFNWWDLGFIATGAILFLVAFGARKMSRNPTLLELCAPGSDSCIPQPGLWDYIVVSFASYSSHSYEGLARALNTEWGFGGGLAHSPALGGFFESLFGPRTVPVVTDQLEQYGWHATYYWSTGLTWLANDVPWVLIPLVVALQGIILALSWRRALRYGDWLSLGVFSYSWLSLFFMMQNLQLALSGPTQLGYIALVTVFTIRGILSASRRRRSSDQVAGSRERSRDASTS